MNSLQFSDPELFTDPYPIYATYRAREPIHFSNMYGGSWILFKYEDCKALLKDPRITNDRSTLPVKALPENQRKPFERFTEFLTRWVAFHEGNDHLIRRKILNSAFRFLTPSLVSQITSEISNYLLSSLPKDQPIDLVSLYAEPMASLVLTQLVGAPSEDHEQLNEWASDLSYLFATSQITTENMTCAWESAQRMMDYFKQLASSPQLLPEFSILGNILNTRSDEYLFSIEDACAQCVLLFFAALEPSRDIITNAIHALDAFPDQRQVLAEKPEAWATAIDEFLRFDPPVQYIGRMAGESFNYRGYEIKKGQMVFPHVGSANRDSATYTNPDQLDVTRIAKNLSMGEGPHRCIGYRMVKVQAEAALKTLFNNYPKLKVSQNPSPVWNKYAGFHGLKSLHVTL